MTPDHPPTLKPMLTVQVLASQDLTKQELAVLALLCQGMTRKAIAKSRHRSLGTVGKQVENLARKLEAHSTAEIVAKAVARGIVSISLQVIVWLLVGLGIFIWANHPLPTAVIQAVWPVSGGRF